MVRVRKLVLAIAAASALSSGMAHALGLGEVTLQSSLNQPLVAEIELLEVRDLASNEVIPSLASPEEFVKAGVDRQYFLTDLKFTPVLKPNGKSVIRVTSSKAVREPYLNFLVEVLWPNGRLLREYTLLLDPPLYSPQTTVAAAPQLPIAAPAPRPSVAPAPVPRSAAPAPAPRPAAPAPASRAISGNEYRTTANDTLWEIAQRVGGGSSVNQTMLAIQDLNPDAFIGGNINRMKSGQVLRLPDEQQIRSRSNAEAVAQVAEQNAAWREGRAVASRQLDATRRTTAGSAPATAESADSLKLVAAEAGQSTRGSDTGSANSKALADKLAVTQESLDSTRRENAELQSRVGDLQSQLDKLQRLVELKDSQLAKLQADLSAAPAAEEGATAQAPVTEPASQAPAAQPEAAPPAAEAATPPASPPEEAAPDYNYSEEPAASVEDSAAANEQPAEEPAAAVEPAAPAKPAEDAKPAAPSPAPAPAPQSFIDDLMANPMTLGLAGGGALLLLLVALMALSRRNAMKEAELQDELADDLSQDQAFASDLDMPEDSLAGLDDEPVATPVAGEERVTAQTGDALGEADIYIAYGRFNQAAELLQNAINDEPHRSDLRLKLMEVYAELGDREGFARQDNELREIGGATAEAEQLKSKYPAIAAFAGAGVVAAAASAEDDVDAFSLDDLSLDEPVAEAPVAASGDLDDAFDLSLDDLEADLENDLQSAKADEAPLSLDDELDFGLIDEPAAPTAAADDDLDFDLALGDDKVELSQPADDLSAFSLDLDEPAAASSDETDEFLLSLDDDTPLSQPADDLSGLSLDLPEETPAADLDLPADFDLSLEDEAPVQPAVEPDSFAAQLDEVTAELDQLSNDFDEPQAPPLASVDSLSSDLDGDDDFDFLSGTDETATKLDLARAYIDMGDTEGARDILDEVVAEGNDAQQQEAREMISKLV
ncbi:FimV/HubP family polar landmark protein [Ectopseudomonas mendocina]|uniref:Peptigoglycan-binding protein LysM n=1 Tax=Ectopseudomonas mendocina S5.2 TaxID=1225174 RepID=A0ABN4IXS3_ECTME|nr:FimV/HubP family polar landmark protein [Pseudomonas mendocina]ALN19684.1 peptigoglycan-binding protein LysM [Pseudomonas mendocina S5.2]KER99433.1 peptigoglycan-binding protein LysM [Pseudomonas mendocina]